MGNPNAYPHHRAVTGVHLLQGRVGHGEECVRRGCRESWSPGMDFQAQKEQAGAGGGSMEEMS